MTCKQWAKEFVGDEWTLGNMNGLSTEEFWTWAKKDTTGYDGHSYLAMLSALTLRGSHGSSWGSVCGRSIRVSTSTT